jgi:predicted Zn-dependent protease
MRSIWMMSLILGLSLPPLPAQAEGIVDVLQRSQRMRLEMRGSADESSPASARVRATFQRLLAAAPGPEPVTLRLVGGELYAEAVFGRTIAVSESVGDLPEGERQMLLAHELGHLRLGHWKALTGLYLQFIPGEVQQAATDRVAGDLGAQAHRLSHRQEFEADAFGFTLVRKLGLGLDAAMGLLTRHGMLPDTATHPGTRRRIAQIRSLAAQLDQPTLALESPAAVATRVVDDGR